jgi:hypothetical protein
MTGNFFIDALISITGIAAIVLIARLVFPASAIRITEATARERIAFDEPDFAPLHWLLDAQGRAALAEGAAGDFILISPQGLDVVTRRFRAGAAKVWEQAGVLNVKLLDVTLPKVSIADKGAAQWAMKLTNESDR